MKTPLTVLGLLLISANSRAATPTAASLAAFNTYAQTTELRLAQQHRSPTTFLTPSNPLVEHLPAPMIDGAMLHHWRGTAFAPGATAADFERLIRNFNAYPQAFAPEVTAATTVTQTPDHITATMRVRQRHVITVVMDTAFNITFGYLDLHHGYSISHSTHISEITNPNTPTERALTPAEDHGFLWRLNTYWSYEERDGGLALQIETISLTRDIPTGLAWAVRPYVESVPRESMEFTLNSAIKAIRK